MPGPSLFDYVVVGAGPAGCVLARRLAEARYSVCLLEAGQQLTPDRADVAMIIFATAVLKKGDEIIDTNTVSPQKVLGGRTPHLVTGRVVGGSTQLNLAIWLRGSARDYDYQADSTGADWLRFESLVPFFRKSETFHYPLAGGEGINHDLHGNSGPIHVAGISATARKLPLRSRTEQALRATGVQWTTDVNAGDIADKFGEIPHASWYPLGGRMAASRYLAELPSGLQLVCGATVDRVLFEGDRAIGVTTATGTEYRARKEVIISAGGLRSPGILQRSGIGHVDVLRKLDIPIIKGLPGVGQNLWDHPFIQRRWRVKALDKGFTLDDLRKPDRLQEEMARYGADGTGLLGGLAWDFVIWKNFSKQIDDAVQAEKTLSDAEKAYLLDPGTGHVQYMVNYSYGTGPIAGSDSHISVAMIMDTPSSRGSVHIVSKDPLVKPLVDIAWLTTNVDKELTKQGLKYAAEIVHAEGLRDLVEKEVGPSGEYPLTSDEALEKYTSDHVETGWHYSGTCAMGPSDRQSAVVDTECRVYGVEALRVIDASVFTVPIAANMQAPVYAVAEAMADRIIRGNTGV